MRHHRSGSAGVRLEHLLAGQRAQPPRAGYFLWRQPGRVAAAKKLRQWYPDLTEDNRFIDQPYLPEDGYHLSKDLVDQALQMIRDQKASNPSKPWFMWLCPGANHAPHHAPKEYIDKYKGKFDDGYGAYREWVLPRSDGSSITSNRPASSTTRSSSIARTTAPPAKAAPAARSTRTSSSTATPTNCRRISSTWMSLADSTPYQMFKRDSEYADGTCCPMVVHWPKVYRGVEQYPFSGVSMHYTFEATPDAPTQKQRQYYAMLGTRGSTVGQADPVHCDQPPSVRLGPARSWLRHR